MPDSTTPDMSPSEPTGLWRGGRRLTVFVAVSVAAVAVLAGAVSVGRLRPREAPVRPSAKARAAPVFAVPDIRDPSATIETASYRGTPIVLNFWASWCVPCRTELPAFRSAQRRLGDDVQFLGMSHQDNREDGLDLLERAGISYPSGYDPKGDVARAFGLYGMPTTVFISADGRVVATRTGEMTEPQLLRAVRDLFGVDGGT